MIASMLVTKGENIYWMTMEGTVFLNTGDKKLKDTYSYISPATKWDGFYLAGADRKIYSIGNRLEPVEIVGAGRGKSVVGGEGVKGAQYILGLVLMQMYIILILYYRRIHGPGSKVACS